MLNNFSSRYTSKNKDWTRSDFPLWLTLHPWNKNLKGQKMTWKSVPSDEERLNKTKTDTGVNRLFSMICICVHDELVLVLQRPVPRQTVLCGLYDRFVNTYGNQWAWKRLTSSSVLPATRSRTFVWLPLHSHTFIWIRNKGLNYIDWWGLHIQIFHTLSVMFRRVEMWKLCTGLNILYIICSEAK